MSNDNAPKGGNESGGAWKIILLVIAGLFVLGLLLPDAAPAPEAGALAEPAELPQATTITAAEFNQISTGMSQADVEAIIGGAGQLISENEIAGTRTQMFQWEGEGGFGANANAMFQDGKLIQKAQFGLE